MNFFDHKDLGNHLLQECSQVVKHPVCQFTKHRFKICMYNCHIINLAIPESHLDDKDNVAAAALVSLLTLLFVFVESSPFLDLVSEMKITLKLKEMVLIKFSSD